MFEHLEIKIKAHAVLEYPKESCGLIYGNEYHPCKNIHPNPTNAFEISFSDYPNYEDLQAVVHSHTDENKPFPEMTYDDMKYQIQSGKPWGIVSVEKQEAHNILWWGHPSFIPELKGREHRYGPSGTDGRGDCYAILTDWYFLNFGIQLKEYPRKKNFWHQGIDDPIYEKQFEDCGFFRLPATDLPLPGDIALMRVRSRKVINHAAVYIGNGKMIHHLEDQVSRVDTIHRWQKFIQYFLRYKG